MPPAPVAELRRGHFALFIAAFGAIVGGMELGMTSWLGGRGNAHIVRPDYMIDVGRDAKSIPEPVSDRPTVLLLGNSQMYSLAGLKRGMPLRNETTETFFDQFVQRVDGYLGSNQATYYRLAYPNQLPFEYLTTYCDLLSRGYRPNIVVMSWNWPNIARERDLRHSIHLLYKRPEFVAWLVGHVEIDPSPGAEDVLAAIKAEVRKVKTEVAQQDAMSDADKLDHGAVAWLADHTTLVGESSEIRSRVYRAIVNGVQERVVQNVDGYQRGVVRADLDFNIKCLHVLLNLLQQYRARVLIYEEPLRGDLPSFVETSQREAVIGELASEVRSHGFSYVDARAIVPDEYWGWAGNYPDRGHFTEDGHRILAEFLFEAGRKEGLWDSLRTAADLVSQRMDADEPPLAN